jgi:PII-like signaling protein
LHASVFVRLGDTHAGRPLYQVIIDRAQAAGLGGATAVRGLLGFGASARLRQPGLAGPRGAGPVRVDIVDDAAKVRAFLTALEGLISSGVVVVRPVTVTRRTAEPDAVATAAPP